MHPNSFWNSFPPPSKLLTQWLTVTQRRRNISCQLIVLQVKNSNLGQISNRRARDRTGHGIETKINYNQLLQQINHSWNLTVQIVLTEAQLNDIVGVAGTVDT